jgi:hypothetical protein
MATAKGYTIPDWHQANANIVSDATQQRFDANATKFLARTSVNETNNQVGCPMSKVDLSDF